MTVTTGRLSALVLASSLPLGLGRPVYNEQPIYAWRKGDDMYLLKQLDENGI